MGALDRAIDTFGLVATTAKTREVAKFVPQNPYRHVGTVIYWLRREAAEKK